MVLTDTTSRRRVLKLSGAAVAATVGVGTASADHYHADVATGLATNVQEAGATLNGELLDMGNASSVDVWFDWGRSTNYGNSTPRQTLTSPDGFSEWIGPLDPDTRYYFRAVSDTGDIVTTADYEIFETKKLDDPTCEDCTK